MVDEEKTAENWVVARSAGLDPVAGEKGHERFEPGAVFQFIGSTGIRDIGLTEPWRAAPSLPRTQPGSAW